MSKAIETIKQNGYSVIKKENHVFRGMHFLYVGKPGEERPVPMGGEQTLYFMCGNKPKTRSEAEEIIKSGAGFKVTNHEIYKEYYGLDEEQMCNLEHGYSLEKRKEIEEEMKNIGFLRYTDKQNDKKDVTENDIMTGKATIYELETEERGSVTGYIIKSEKGWIMEILRGIEGERVIKMYFSRKPSREEAQKAFKIYEIG